LWHLFFGIMGLSPNFWYYITIISPIKNDIKISLSSKKWYNDMIVYDILSFNVWFLLYKMWLKLAKNCIFWHFWKVSFFCCYCSKTVGDENWFVCMVFRNLHALGYLKSVIFFCTHIFGLTSPSAWCGPCALCKGHKGINTQNINCTYCLIWWQWLTQH
jgi:hypothetical protein